MKQQIKTAAYWIMFALLLICANSCTTSHLHYKGSYEVESIEGSRVKFKGVKQQYSTSLDSLNRGEVLKLTPTRNKSKAHFIPLK